MLQCTEIFNHAGHFILMKVYLMLPFADTISTLSHLTMLTSNINYFIHDSKFTVCHRFICMPSIRFLHIRIRDVAQYACDPFTFAV